MSRTSPSLLTFGLSHEVDIDSWYAANFPPLEKEMFRATKPCSVEDPAVVQRAYGKCAKITLRRVLGDRTVECGADGAVVFDAMTAQFTQKKEAVVVADWWTSCADGLDEVAREFTAVEVLSALDHRNSAPGTSGLRYRDFREMDPDGSKLAALFNLIKETGVVPACWKSYDTLLLFKKPREYSPGDEEIFKKFRPIALLDVGYKVLTAVLAARLSKWLKTNNAISVNQRAVFGRRGCLENSVLARIAVDEKKTLVFLDLADAFNSIGHKLIETALVHSGCPQWIVELFRTLYVNTFTIPIGEGKVGLCEPISIKSGVRQGCPLSPILFVLAINPLLRSAEEATGVPLAYIDDVAIVCDDSSRAQIVLDAVVARARSLGLVFNAAKCGTTSSVPITINGGALPSVDDDSMYDYLGTRVGRTRVGGADARFRAVLDDIKTMAASALKPQQKVHALRTFLLPRLQFVLQNSNTASGIVDKADKEVLAVTKKLLYVPSKACTGYIRSPRHAGAPGIPSLLEIQARYKVTDAVRCSQLDSAVGQCVRARLVRIGSASFPELDAGHAISRFINGIGRPRPIAGGCGWVGAIRSGLRILRRHVSCEVSVEADNYGQLSLLVDGAAVVNGWLTLKRMVEEFWLGVWVGAPNQGRYAPVIASSTTTNRLPFSFRFPFADWRFVHKARLNLCAVRGGLTWAPGDKTCRRCQGDVETQAHVLSLCPAHKACVMARHAAVLKVVTARLPSSCKVAVEQRIGDLIPDLVVTNASGAVMIADAKVGIDLAARFEANAADVDSKYGALRTLLSVGSARAKLLTLQVGLLCTSSPTALLCLRELGMGASVAVAALRRIAAICCHWARNAMVGHLTGVQQTF